MQPDTHRSDNVLMLLDPSLNPSSGHARRNAEAFAREAASAGRPFVLYATELIHKEQMHKELTRELRTLGAEIVGLPFGIRRIPSLRTPMIRQAASMELTAFRDAAELAPKATIVFPDAKPQTLWAAAQVNWRPTQRVVLQFMTPERWRWPPEEFRSDHPPEVPQVYRMAARDLVARGGVLATQSPGASAYLAHIFGCPVRTLPFSCLNWTGTLPEKVELRPTPRIGVLNFSRPGKLHDAAIETARRTIDRADWVIHMGAKNHRMGKLRSLADQTGRLEIIEGGLPSEQYNELIASLDAILLPYNAKNYRLHMSGMVIDAMCQAVIPLAPAGSAPAAVMAADGLGVEFETSDADGMVAAVEEFLGRRNMLAPRALSRAPVFRKRHTAAGFLAACEC